MEEKGGKRKTPISPRVRNPNLVEEENDSIEQQTPFVVNDSLEFDVLEYFQNDVPYRPAEERNNLDINVPPLENIEAVNTPYFFNHHSRRENLILWGQLVQMPLIIAKMDVKLDPNEKIIVTKLLLKEDESDIEVKILKEIIIVAFGYDKGDIEYERDNSDILNYVKSVTLNETYVRKIDLFKSEKFNVICVTKLSNTFVAIETSRKFFSQNRAAENVFLLYVKERTVRNIYNVVKETKGCYRHFSNVDVQILSEDVLCHKNMNIHMNNGLQKMNSIPMIFYKAKRHYTTEMSTQFNGNCSVLFAFDDVLFLGTEILHKGKPIQNNIVSQNVMIDVLLYYDINGNKELRLNGVTSSFRSVISSLNLVLCEYKKFVNVPEFGEVNREIVMEDEKNIAKIVVNESRRLSTWKRHNFKNYSREYQRFVIFMFFAVNQAESPLNLISYDVLEHCILPYLYEIDVFLACRREYSNFIICRELEVKDYNPNPIFTCLYDRYIEPRKFEFIQKGKKKNNDNIGKVKYLCICEEDGMDLMSNDDIISYWNFVWIMENLSSSLVYRKMLDNEVFEIRSPENVDSELFLLIHCFGNSIELVKIFDLMLTNPKFQNTFIQGERCANRLRRNFMTLSFIETTLRVLCCVKFDRMTVTQLLNKNVFGLSRLIRFTGCLIKLISIILDASIGDFENKTILDSLCLMYNIVTMICSEKLVLKQFQNLCGESYLEEVFSHVLKFLERKFSLVIGFLQEQNNQISMLKSKDNSNIKEKMKAFMMMESDLGETLKGRDVFLTEYQLCLSIFLPLFKYVKKSNFLLDVLMMFKDCLMMDNQMVNMIPSKILDEQKINEMSNNKWLGFVQSRIINKNVNELSPIYSTMCLILRILVNVHNFDISKILRFGTFVIIELLEEMLQSDQGRKKGAIAPLLWIRLVFKLKFKTIEFELFQFMQMFHNIMEKSLLGKVGRNLNIDVLVFSVLVRTLEIHRSEIVKSNQMRNFVVKKFASLVVSLNQYLNEFVCVHGKDEHFHELVVEFSNFIADFLNDVNMNEKLSTVFNDVCVSSMIENFSVIIYEDERSIKKIMSTILLIKRVRKRIKNTKFEGVEIPKYCSDEEMEGLALFFGVYKVLDEVLQYPFKKICLNEDLKRCKLEINKITDLMFKSNKYKDMTKGLCLIVKLIEKHKNEQTSVFNNLFLDYIGFKMKENLVFILWKVNDILRKFTNKEKKVKLSLLIFNKINAILKQIIFMMQSKFSVKEIKLIGKFYCTVFFESSVNFRKLFNSHLLDLRKNIYEFNIVVDVLLEVTSPQYLRIIVENFRNEKDNFGYLSFVMDIVQSNHSLLEIIKEVGMFVRMKRTMVCDLNRILKNCLFIIQRFLKSVEFSSNEDDKEGMKVNKIGENKVRMPFSLTRLKIDLIRLCYSCMFYNDRVPILSRQIIERITREGRKNGNLSQYRLVMKENYLLHHLDMISINKDLLNGNVLLESHYKKSTYTEKFIRRSKNSKRNRMNKRNFKMLISSSDEQEVDFAGRVPYDDVRKSLYDIRILRTCFNELFEFKVEHVGFNDLNLESVISEMGDNLSDYNNVKFNNKDSLMGLTSINDFDSHKKKDRKKNKSKVDKSLLPLKKFTKILSNAIDNELSFEVLLLADDVLSVMKTEINKETLGMIGKSLLLFRNGTFYLNESNDWYKSVLLYKKLINMVFEKLGYLESITELKWFLKEYFGSNLSQLKKETLIELKTEVFGCLGFIKSLEKRYKHFEVEKKEQTHSNMTLLKKFNLFDLKAPSTKSTGKDVDALFRLNSHPFDNNLSEVRDWKDLFRSFKNQIDVEIGKYDGNSFQDKRSWKFKGNDKSFRKSRKKRTKREIRNTNLNLNFDKVEKNVKFDLGRSKTNDFGLISPLEKNAIIELEEMNDYMNSLEDRPSKFEFDIPPFVEELESNKSSTKKDMEVIDEEFNFEISGDNDIFTNGGI